MTQHLLPLTKYLLKKIEHHLHPNEFLHLLSRLKLKLKLKLKLHREHERKVFYDRDLKLHLKLRKIFLLVLLHLPKNSLLQLDERLLNEKQKQSRVLFQWYDENDNRYNYKHDLLDDHKLQPEAL